METNAHDVLLERYITEKASLEERLAGVQREIPRLIDSEIRLTHCVAAMDERIQALREPSSQTLEQTHPVDALSGPGVE